MKGLALRKVNARSLIAKLAVTACLTSTVATYTAIGYGDPDSENQLINSRYSRDHQTNPVDTVISNRPSTITNVKWWSDHRVEMWVYSQSMNTVIPMQLLLARDWNYRPEEKFPSLYLLDGIEARSDQSGWLLNTDAEHFFRDKNVNVVLPVGGKSSFYTNWKRPDQGKNYQWETFLTKELPPLMESSWRANSIRGIEGISMGGTAAMALAARNPGFYAYAGSFSGMLDLTTTGMPLAIHLAQMAYGNFDSINMYGPPSDPLWAQHDPLTLAENLRGTSLYISSGSGIVNQDHNQIQDPNPKIGSDPAIRGVEMISRVSSERMVSKLNQLSIPVRGVFRASGTHSWPYWQFELQQSWPQAAKALSVTPKESCVAGGAIGAMIRKHRNLGVCMTPEYNIIGGKAQDFDNGRILWSPKTGARSMYGPIAGAYIGSGSTSGDLGFPISDVIHIGKVDVQKFAKGDITWSERNGAHPIHGAIFLKWKKDGAVLNPIGIPLEDEISTYDGMGRIQGFDNGSIYYSPGTGTHPVSGFLYIKYAVQKYEQGLLGLPVEDAKRLSRGAIMQRFSGGNLYQTNKGVFNVPNAVLSAWGDIGYERGRFGYPISDAYLIPGGCAQKFENGTISIVNGIVNYES